MRLERWLPVVTSLDVNRRSDPNPVAIFTGFIFFIRPCSTAISEYLLTISFKKVSAVADPEKDRQSLGVVMPGNRAVCQAEATQHKPDDLMHQFFTVHLVVDHRLFWQMIDGNHGGEVMRETHAVLPADRAFNGVA